MFTLFKRSASVALLVLFGIIAVLPAMSYELDYFPKFDAKKHFYVQKESVPPNMDDSFFAEMEERLVSIEKNYGVHIYFVCANSDQQDGQAMSSSVENYDQILWREWAYQGMSEQRTAIIVLASNQAQDPSNCKFCSLGFYDTGLPLPYLSSDDAQYTLRASADNCLEQRPCPHQFVRTVILHLRDQCADLHAKEKEEASRKEAETKAAAKAAEEAKIQAARQSDGGSNVGSVTTPAKQKSPETCKQVLLSVMVLLSVIGLAGTAVWVASRKRRT